MEDFDSTGTSTQFAHPPDRVPDVKTAIAGSKESRAASHSSHLRFRMLRRGIDQVWKSLSRNSRHDPISNTVRKDLGPFVHRLVGDADSVGGSSGRTPKQFNSF